MLAGMHRLLMGLTRVPEPLWMILTRSKARSICCEERCICAMSLAALSIPAGQMHMSVRSGIQPLYETGGRPDSHADAYRLQLGRMHSTAQSGRTCSISLDLAPHSFRDHSAMWIHDVFQMLANAGHSPPSEDIKGANMQGLASRSPV